MRALIFLLFLGLSISGNANQSCGLEGPIEDRVSDCNQSCQPSRARLKTNWKLVSRSDRGLEVWQNERTGLIWSALYPFRVSAQQAKEICEQHFPEDFKGGLSAFWELPKEWTITEELNHGLLECVPNMNGQIWVNEYVSNDRAYIFDGTTRNFFASSTRFSYDFRCVAR